MATATASPLVFRSSVARTLRTCLAVSLVLSFGATNQAQTSQGSPQTGPASRYFVTGGNQGVNWILRRSTATPFAQQHWFIQAGVVFGEHAIAVHRNRVRTLGTNALEAVGLTSPGSEYTLRGVYTGTDFAYPADAGTLAFLDATTDGTHIYAVAHNLNVVYQMDMDWSNPVFLFSVRPNDIGITYDPSNRSLWVSSVSENQFIVNYSLEGLELSSFQIPTGASALALDPADDTLWFTHGFDGALYQYSRAGDFLGSITYPAMAGWNHLGGEFDLRIRGLGRE